MLLPNRTDVVVDYAPRFGCRLPTPEVVLEDVNIEDGTVRDIGVALVEE